MILNTVVKTLLESAWMGATNICLWHFLTDGFFFRYINRFKQLIVFFIILGISLGLWEIWYSKSGSLGDLFSNRSIVWLYYILIKKCLHISANIIRSVFLLSCCSYCLDDVAYKFWSYFGRWLVWAVRLNCVPL